MPRILRYPAHRIALIAALAILGGALAAYAMHDSRDQKPSAAAPAPAAPSVALAPSATPQPSAPTGPVPAPARASAITPPAQEMPHGAAGMVVGIDPETGALGMPSKADRALLERTANMSPSIDRSDVGLTVVHKPDGSRMVDLKGRFQNYMVVRLTPDGRKVESCVEEPGVGKALDGAATQQAGVETAPSPDDSHEDR